MTPEQAAVALGFHFFGEEAARQMADKYGVRFEEVDLSEKALDQFDDLDCDDFTA